MKKPLVVAVLILGLGLGGPGCGDDASGGDGGAGDDDDDDDDISPDGGGNAGSGPYFPAGSFYYEDISDVTPVANSADITAYMEEQYGPNGWGTGEMRMDFSIATNRAAAGVTRYPFELVDDYYYEGECDLAPMPLPAGGVVEVHWEFPPDFSGALTGYDCIDFNDGADCHMIVFAPDENRLYEIYHATYVDGTFYGGCQAVWDTSQVATAAGRGQQCSSADAAGYAIAPLLVTPDEVANDELHHAVRLILPNDIIRGGTYHPPATHGTDTTGPADTLPYGGRMRLRADYPVEDLAPAAQVIARAMQTYGMMLADGGQIALTLESDVLYDNKWEDLGIDSFSLSALRASDFDVIIAGDPIETGATDCVHDVIEE
jgi:hypothetical protein